MGKRVRVTVFTDKVGSEDETEFELEGDESEEEIEEIAKETAMGMIE